MLVGDAYLDLPLVTGITMGEQLTDLPECATDTDANPVNIQGSGPRTKFAAYLR